MNPLKKKNSAEDSAWRFVDKAFDIKTDTPTQKAVLLCLANHADEKTGECYPDYVLQMDDSSIGSKSTIADAIAYLRDDLEIITWEKGWGNKVVGKANTYKFDFDAMKNLADKDVEGRPARLTTLREKLESHRDKVKARHQRESAKRKAKRKPVSPPSVRTKNEVSESICPVAKYTSPVAESICPVAESSKWTVASHLSNVPSQSTVPSKQRPRGNAEHLPEKDANTDAENGLASPMVVSPPSVRTEINPVSPPSVLSDSEALSYDDHDRRWYARIGVNRALTGEEITEMQRRNNLRLTPEAMTV